MQALYRRYRPDTFEEVIGQDAVVSALQRALKNGRIGHAYLFSGPRGCGKTTSARIFARALNCENGPTPTPCGKCASCVDLATGGPGSVDVIEMDAASHNGVDDARDLRDRLEFAPTRDRFKIVILDEAHMITGSAFNALLKVVEEPPEHVKFIFATTEPNKVIPTIRSRTYHYAFRLVAPAIMTNLLKSIANDEKMQVEEGVFPLIVRAGKGSVRDTLSVYDQLFAASQNSKVEKEFAANLLGMTSSELISNFIVSLTKRDTASMFSVIEKTTNSGVEPVQFLSDILEEIRIAVFMSLISSSAISNAREQLKATFGDLPDSEIKLLSDLAAEFPNELLIKISDIIADGINSIKGIILPSIQLELVIARISSAFTAQIQATREIANQGQPKQQKPAIQTTIQTTPQTTTNHDATSPNPKNTVQNTAQKAAQKAESANSAPANNSTPNPKNTAQNNAGTNSENNSENNSRASFNGDATEKWNLVLEELSKTSKSASKLLEKQATASTSNSKLILSFSQENFYNTFVRENYQAKLEAALLAIYKSKVQLEIIVGNKVALQSSVGETSNSENNQTDKTVNAQKSETNQTSQNEEAETDEIFESEAETVAQIETTNDLVDDIFGA